MKKEVREWEGLDEIVEAQLNQMQEDMFNRAKEERDASIVKSETWEEFMGALNQKKIVVAPWCEKVECEEDVKERSKEDSKAAENEGEEILTGAAKTLCLPLEQESIEEGTKCFACDECATKRALWGRSY